MAAVAWDSLTPGEKARKAYEYYVVQGGTASGFGTSPTFHRRDFEPGGSHYFMVPQPGSAGGAGGGGGSAGSAPGAGPSAGAVSAVNAHQAMPTGGGAGFSIGAVENSTVISAWPGEWEGIDTTSPEEKMPEALSPEATNWNALERFGSRCVRRGVAKMSEDRETITISASPIHADYRGVSIMPLAPDYMLLCMADNDGTIGAALSAQPISLWVLSTFPMWGRPVDLRTYPGPKLTLTEPSTKVIRVTYDYSNVWSTVAMQKISCKSVTIRYNSGAVSGAVTYPIELDTIADDDTNGRRAGTAAKDRATWDGTSATVDIDLSASGTTGDIVYVSAWAHSLLGTSERSVAARAIS